MPGLMIILPIIHYLLHIYQVVLLFANIDHLTNLGVHYYFIFLLMYSMELVFNIQPYLFLGAVVYRLFNNNRFQKYYLLGYFITVIILASLGITSIIVIQNYSYSIGFIAIFTGYLIYEAIMTVMSIIICLKGWALNMKNVRSTNSQVEIKSYQSLSQDEQLPAI